MARPLRIEFAGALYHVTARGDRRERIFDDDEDRRAFLLILGDVIGQFGWICYAYCLMDNHYHLVVETPHANLSRGMRQLNGIYTQYSNRRHGRVGHLFQGRYKAILVDRDAHLLELSRYVPLNPVRAKRVKSPSRWPWSSYGAMVGRRDAPAWLAVDALLANFARSRSVARQRYRQFVAEGIEAPGPWQALRGQIYLGDERFVEQMQARLAGRGDDINIPRTQRRRPAQTLAAIERTSSNRDEAILAAYETGHYSYAQIARHFGVHFTTVGRIVRDERQRRQQAAAG